MSLTSFFFLGAALISRFKPLNIAEQSLIQFEYIHRRKLVFSSNILLQPFEFIAEPEETWNMNSGESKMNRWNRYNLQNKAFKTIFVLSFTNFWFWINLTICKLRLNDSFPSYKICGDWRHNIFSVKREH